MSVTALVFQPDKFKDVSVTEVEGVNIIDNSLGYMICEKVDSIDNETHTLFIGRLVEADMFHDTKEMTYGYYQEHKDELLGTTNDEGKTIWVCSVCGYVYDGKELPGDFKCPICGVPSNLFEKK